MILSTFKLINKITLRKIKIKMTKKKIEEVTKILINLKLGKMKIPKLEGNIMKKEITAD